MKSTAEILREARALIDTPDKWIRDYYAEDPNGWPVDPDNPDACRFCARGAIYHVIGAEIVGEAEMALRAVVQAADKGYDRVAAFNDDESTSHADVLAAFDRAITLAETQA